MTTPAAWVEAWRVEPFEPPGDTDQFGDRGGPRRSSGEARGSTLIACSSVTGLAGLFGTSLLIRSTCG